MLRIAVVILLCAAVALGAVVNGCEIAQSVSVPAGQQIDIISCTYVGLQYQSRCITYRGRSPVMISFNGAENIDLALITGTGDCLLSTGCTVAPCSQIGGCTGVELYRCYNISSSPFTVTMNATCYDSSACVGFYNFTMNTYCGDGVCGPGESCANCIDDCCPSPSASASRLPSSSTSASLAAQASPSRSPSASRVASASASASVALASAAPSQSLKNTQSGSATLGISLALCLVTLLW